MTMKKKTFDCVDMKDGIQRNLVEEYRARKNEFSSYVDYLHASLHENEWSRKQLQCLVDTHAHS